MRTLCLLFFLFAAAAATAADHPYNETADARLEIKQALAATNNTPIILVFGANWCPDCIVLDAAMKKGASAKLLANDFRIMKIDVGRKDKNQDLAKSYGITLTEGIPAVVIISPKNEVLYVTRPGELADARKMSDDGIYQFFKQVITAAKKKE